MPQKKFHGAGNQDLNLWYLKGDLMFWFVLLFFTNSSLLNNLIGEMSAITNTY